MLVGNVVERDVRPHGDTPILQSTCGGIYHIGILDKPCQDAQMPDVYVDILVIE